MNNDFPMDNPSATVPIAPPMEDKRFELPKQKSKILENSEIRQLTLQGFSTGLARAMTENNASFPLRIWVVDNSGSMATCDGHRMVETKKSSDVKMVPCTRWSEIQDTVNYHVQMSALLQAPTVFRLLNDPGARVGPQQFSVAEQGATMIESDVETARQTMQNSSPGGVTPLFQHIRDIRESVSAMADTLRRDGTRVAIILATDGLPTNEKGIGDSHVKQQFVDSLRSLEGLPVWVVVRLCTDDEDVVEFYNNIDAQLELSLEVLDDFVGEATEVYEHNAWLNYTLALHRCREMGYHNRLFDLLDERTLTKGELRDFCMLLFGNSMFDSVPEPEVDWEGFIKAVAGMASKENKQWNPMKKKMTPIVDVKKMAKMYGDSSCNVM
mmetsp:Transcript_11088/g.20231  ORF Transcript_11088/g.20231 Transcript_11088/m.20231 type:complete len:383 (-) Transcript_11088:112-1260(-)